MRVSSERRRRSWLAVVIVSFAILVGSRERADAMWSTQGPYGGDVTALAVAPGAAPTVYAGTAFDGVFRSVDGGVQWQAASTGLGNGVIYALAVDPVAITNRSADRLSPLTATVRAPVKWAVPSTSLTYGSSPSTLAYLSRRMRSTNANSSFTIAGISRRVTASSSPGMP